MPEKVVIKVWIEQGCIVCDACETECPEIFEVKSDSSTIREEAMNAETLRTATESLKKAAEGCPVEVIKFEEE